jgi:plasmid stabilization system protein ParE
VDNPELVFLFSAESDILLAWQFQEDLGEGRGDGLLKRLEAAFDRLRKFPECAPVYHQKYRRLLVPGFPYGIFYSLEGRRLIVVGVMDLRQNPSSVRKRLKSLTD